MHPLQRPRRAGPLQFTPFFRRFTDIPTTLGDESLVSGSKPTKMKKILTIALLLGTVSLYAQTAEEVVKEYTARMGGLEKFKSIKTVKMSGTVSVQGMELPITIQVINGKAVRTDVEVMGSSVISAYKDGKGWKQNAFAGAPDPTDMEVKELEDIEPQIHITNALMDYKATGATIALLGKETVDGKEAFKILCTPSSGKSPTTYYLNSSDYTIIKTVTRTELMGSEVELETHFSNLQEVDGRKFYMGRLQKADGNEFQDIQFKTIELNVPIDESIFTKP